MTYDPREQARLALAPDGRQLTALMEGLIQDAAQALSEIRQELRGKARSGKGLSGRTLVEWHKAEAGLMARAKAIAALTSDQGRGPSTYEAMLRDLTAAE
jgi:hypothetical protein